MAEVELEEGDEAGVEKKGL